MNFSLIFAVFVSLVAANCHVEKTAFNLNAEIPLKLQDGYGDCRCFCPRDKALLYVAEVDAVLTTYIKMAQFDMMASLIASTATYAIVKPGRCTGCFKFTGELDPEVMWGCIDYYNFEPLEHTYYKNGVVVVRGTETVKKGKHVVFKGEVSRYYSADVGCQYRLEMIVGSDVRCTCCNEVGCTEPSCRMLSSSSSSSNCVP
jgi:hypothetical protein